MLDLHLLDQVLHRTSTIFDWNVRVDAMLIEKINDLSLNALQ
jgi:hypothetical protein